MINNEHIQNLISSDDKVLSGFRSIEGKKSGARWGFIGIYGDEQHPYLVKRELGGYTTVITKAENDMIVIECLSATLIKIILGNTFAAETIPVRLDCESFKRHKGKENLMVTEEVIQQDLANYGLASKMLRSNITENKRIVSNEREELVKLSVVAVLLGISDIKTEHLIQYAKDEGRHYRQHTALIDCAGDLDGYTRTLENLLLGNNKICSITPKDYGVVLGVFHYLVSVESNLIQAVDKYQHIEVSDCCTNEVLKKKLEKIVAHVKKCIPELEDKIQMHIANGDIKLDKYTTYGFMNLLQNFSEKYRLHILVANIEYYAQEDEDDQSEISMLLPEEDRNKIPKIASTNDIFEEENIPEESVKNLTQFSIFSQQNTSSEQETFSVRPTRRCAQPTTLAGEKNISPLTP